MAKLVTFLTDFGQRDSYVAEMKAVILSQVPNARIVDITNEIPSFNIQEGAFQLFRSYRYFPKGTIHLSVVDPGVGTERKALAVRVADRIFIGPDNGLLFWSVKDYERVMKKKAHYYEIAIGEAVSSTFHGRDVFAPFAAKCLTGFPKKMKELGHIEGRAFPPLLRSGEDVEGEVISIDSFGNLVTSIPITEKLRGEARLGDRMERIQVHDNYAAIPMNRSALIPGSHGFWEVAIREGSASEMFRAYLGEKVRVYGEAIH